MYYEWENQASFDLWHNNLCNSLGYPITPVNQATGLLDETAQKVIRYTDSIELDGVIIAFVADQYADGLTLTDKKPPKKILYSPEQSL